MELINKNLDKLVVKSFKNVTTYDGMIQALRTVIYASEMPKDKKREIFADTLKSLVVSAPEQLNYNGVELAQLLERMLHFASINTWIMQQWCPDCQSRLGKCEACKNGTRKYAQVPEMSVKNLTVKGKPQRVFNGDNSQPRTVEFSFKADKNLVHLSALFESHYPEMSDETRMWLVSSWKSLKEQYEIDKKSRRKPRPRNVLIEELRKTGSVHFLSVLLFKKGRCLNCGDVRPDDKKKYYCSSACDKDFSQFFDDWTFKRRYKGNLDEVILKHLRVVLEKKREQAQLRRGAT